MYTYVRGCLLLVILGAIYLSEAASALYSAAAISLQSGFRNAAGTIQSNTVFPFQNDLWFSTVNLRLELAKVDFFAGVSYLYSESEIGTVGKQTSRGFGDPHAGLAWHLFYENYYIPGMVLESELTIPTGEKEFSAGIWLNRTRLLLTKSFRPATVSLSATALAPFGKPNGMQNQVGIFAASLSRNIASWFYAGVFADYHTNSLSEATAAHHLGLHGGVPVGEGQINVYGGKEILQNSFGWFGGGGIHYYVF